MSANLLIRNGHLLTMDRLGECRNTDILIEDGRISRIGKELEASAAEVIDATDHLVLPGFVDTHRHMWQTQLRGTMVDATLLDYFAMIRETYSACYEPDDVYIGILMGYLEALNAGTTSLIDHCHIMNSPEHAEAAIRAFRDSGAGGVFCYGLFPNPDAATQSGVLRVLTPPERLWQEARDVRSSFFSADNADRIRWGMALTELEFFPLQYSLQELELARELGAHKISAHAGMGVLSKPTKYVKRLAAAGELADDLLMVHGWSLTDVEMASMVEHGVTLSVTPETELQMAMGFPALQRFRRAGGRPGLGIDIASNQSADMFTQMRLGVQSVRALRNMELARRGRFPAKLELTATDVLRAATIDGAHALGLEAEVGSLTEGKRADLILIRKNDINMAPVNDATAAAVHYANVGNIDTVIAGGVVRKRHGILVGHDLVGMIGELLESTERVIGRSAKMDRNASYRSAGDVYPTSRRRALEGRLAATVFHSRFSGMHDRLLSMVAERSARH